MKKLFLLALLSVFAFGDILRVRDFQTDLYSKVGANVTKKINLNLELVGRDLEENESYVLDALNVIIGSFYVEDILTSLGKEKFKETFIKYAAKKHAIDIDDVLILNIKTINDLELNEILKAIRALKGENQSATASEQKPAVKAPKTNEIIISPEINSLNQRPIDLNSVQEF